APWSRKACAAGAAGHEHDRHAAGYRRRTGGATPSLGAKLARAKAEEAQAMAVADDVAPLVDWLGGEVLALDGPAAADRRALYDFIVAELRDRAAQGERRLRSLSTFLDNHRDQLLGFAAQLGRDLAELAARFH